MLTSQNWRSERVGNSFDICTTHDGQRRPIAFCAADLSDDDKEAIAAAIAAVPDMLSALTAASECSVVGTCALCSDRITDAIEAALDGRDWRRVEEPSAPSVSPANGYAAIEDGKINVRTVSPTERAAKINFLVVERGAVILQSHTDNQIALLWDVERGNATVIPVAIVSPETVEAMADALRKITANQYGLQSIIENFPDTNKQNYEARKYYEGEIAFYKEAARAALARYEAEKQR